MGKNAITMIEIIYASEFRCCLKTFYKLTLLTKNHNMRFQKTSFPIYFNCKCCTLIKENIDKRLIHALLIAKEWENDSVPTGDAMKASLAAHAVARESSSPVLISVARSVGQ